MQFNKRKLALPVCVAFLLCEGCAGQYQAPTIGATAKVQFKLDSTNYFAMIHTFAKPGCDGPLAIGLIGGDNAKALNTVIPIERPFTVLYTQLGPNTSNVATLCKIATTFLPKSGGQYSFDFRYQGNSCRVAITNTVKDEQGNWQIERVEDATIESGTCSPSNLAF